MKSESKKKRNVLRILLIIAVVCWMALIFFLSGEGGERSSAISGGVTKNVQKTFFREWDDLSKADYDDHMAGLHFFIRKAAHFSEYLVLGALLAGLALSFGLTPLFTALLSFGTGAVYALSDEWHQSFVAGRSMTGFDVLVDAAGGVFGIALLFAVLFVCQAARQRIKAEKPLES